MRMKTLLKIGPKLGAAFLLLCYAATAQVAADANKNYQTAEGRAGVAKSLENPHRIDRMKPKELIGSLEIKPGSAVADVGTGAGVFLPYLAEAAGPSGRVVAEDIAQDFLDRAQARAKSSGLNNVTFVLGTDRDPKLPEGLDLVYICDVYHHFDYPGEMLGHIKSALKPDGRLVIVDMYRFRKDEDGQDQKNHVRADRDEVIKEIEDNGLRLASYKDHGKAQYVLIFNKK